MRSALNFPDVGVRETQKPHSLTETFSAFALRAMARQARACAVVSKISQTQACLAEAASVFCAAKAGGEYRARTGDLLVANQALSQLS
jgi:hypothetical protein